MVGVSTDDHEQQCRFAESTGAGFPMIGDADHRISGAFGVLWPILKLDRRITFFIDQGGVVRGVFRHELDPKKHVSDAVSMLRAAVPAEARPRPCAARARGGPPFRRRRRTGRRAARSRAARRDRRRGC